jgi:aldehyde dehydrogenase (NAD+)
MLRLSTVPSGPALCAGNTVILKPAEQTPLSTLRLAELVVEAGFPAGVVNIIPGDGTTGAALVAHPLVSKISFTGSTPVGQRVAAEAGKGLKRVSLELGGKNPVIVCADADLDQAVESVHAGLFWNEGEACASGSRIFVHDSIYEEFVRRSVARAQKRRVVHPFAADGNMGCQGAQVSEEQMNKILGYIDSAKREGARLELGGYRMGKEGFYVAPTVFSEVTDAMTVSKEEIFGPVMCLSRFNDVDEVLQRANATPFGLASGVFSQSAKTIQHLSRGLHSGICFVNCYHVVDVSAPFGGRKHSGMGREGGGMYGLEAYLEVKNVVQHVG